ncbi:type VII secretion-associated serine protease [Lentzea sp. NBRC 105346]|uniref:type VII secretion-associated serine protease mycosin n=1 Tax=Lentzea sp. NBRC 105346 TaxID=3032205 RepID=UPI002552A64B|nr:type VII secretion-associated serine protease mycosin [Lentzea sp. NBRC 105346]GLZ30486.1 type VII secretion-associated serine protease [Lentzea sp. NBRC 105346]
MTTVKRVAAVSAAALMLLSGPLSASPAVAQPSSTANKPERPNSQPPPWKNGSPLPPADTIGNPAPDVDYVRNNKQCIAPNNKGTTVNSRPYGQLRLNLEQAHRFATGKNVKVAVIDTGVENHPRLQGRVTALGDYVGKNDGNGMKDCDGHGTEVAGVIAASEDTETDFVGAAPEASILAIRQTSDRFEFKGTPTQEARPTAGKIRTLAQAIVQAAKSGADVINISLTNCAPPKTFGADDEMLQGAIKYAVDVENVVIVTAAGNLSAEQGAGCSAQNDNTDPDNVKVVASPPWFADDVLSVASINEGGIVSDFSVWGPWVSIAGPGEGIVTLDPKGTGLTNANLNPENQQLAPIRGTSFASPYVAGVAALVRERFPELNARQVMYRLKATAQHPGNPNGRDNKIGHGMVNPIAALTAVIPSEKKGATPPKVAALTTQVNPPGQKNWKPMIVALAGTAIGVSMLLLTLFVMHTVNRNRRRPA